MCGICGIFNIDGKPTDRHILKKMADTISHRGPDGDGYHVQNNIALGHRRLSIIDLKGGDQPIYNEDNSICIIFNGEIYNYIELREDLKKLGHLFKTASDTEVIIHGYEEWGLDCVKMFNGIFAFAIWDENKKDLFLARDHLGVKPLYYINIGNTFLFASEIKALLAYPECQKSISIDGLAQLFTFRYVPSPGTLFDGIKKLPPAHYLHIDGQGYKINRYWGQIPQINRNASFNDLVEEYQLLLEDAIRLQLRSDVPLGLFLSSGIDSTVILAIMRKYITSDIFTFTIGFEDGQATNETDEASQMAKVFETKHTEMIVGPTDYQKYYDRYLWDIEEPVGNETAAAFYFVSYLAGKEVKVALTGQGADEPWGGYPRHLGAKFSSFYCKLPRVITESIFKPIARSLPRSEQIKRTVDSLSDPNILSRFTKIYSFFNTEMKDALYKDWVKNEIGYDDLHARGSLSKLYNDVKNQDPLTQMLYIDTRSNLPDDLLMVSDKTSMTNSVEARVPFLDYRLIEFIETIPPNLKINFFKGKYLHKKALEKWLPKKIVHKKKKGFSNPIDKWMLKRMDEYLSDCLQSSNSAVNQYFNQEYVAYLIDQHKNRRGSYMRHLNLLISFELWHKTFLD